MEFEAKIIQEKDAWPVHLQVSQSYSTGQDSSGKTALSIPYSTVGEKAS